jgi:hypothetical protein
VFLSGENVADCSKRDEGVVSRDSSLGDVALNIRAFDKDTDDNAKVVYSLEDNPGNYFEITTDSGMIFVNGNLSDAVSMINDTCLKINESMIYHLMENCASISQ